ncbi:MAG: DegT/DnrJ/EryC1/StrS family aminotransferase [Candidatus Hydrogenedentes bacterium]|nr:DegT/DnrJ/EryC1/StrS family aminotransferase [Candidatus Hydrogenedentota bacterium]
MARDNLDPFRPRAFVQTAGPVLPELDRWRQITEDEVGVVAEMTQRNELSGGTPVVRAFEERWRAWVGTRYALTVMNGTSALYSAYFGLGVGPGDEVICPVNTWICTIAPAVLLGARPVFCDVDPGSLMLDPADVRAKITGRTRCICAVHLWGNVCDMDALTAIGEEHGIPVIEDCSHAHGARYGGHMCGGIGRAGCWSLQGSKAVSAGEGGVLTTDDTDLFERACLVGQVNRIAGMDLVSTRYAEHQPLGLGMKFRAHPLGIGIAAAQLDKLDALNARRRAFIEEVEAGLAEIPGVRPVKVYAGAERGGFYGFPVIHDAEITGVPTAAYVERLNARGLQATLSPYPNLHSLPVFARGFDVFTRNRGPLCAAAGYRGYKPGDFPNAELARRRTIFLPRLSDPVPDAAAIVLDVLNACALPGSCPPPPS